MDADKKLSQSGPAPQSVNDLVALVLERLESEGPAVVEAVCADHPLHADALRRRLSHLRDLGLLQGGSDPAPGTAPERLGGFRLKKRLGGGGMGVVYLAQDEKLGREVALKLIRPELDYFPGARERFRREVETIARLQHPGIVPIYSVGEDGGVPYFTMERVRGCTLDVAIDALKPRGVAGLRGADLQRAIGAQAEGVEDEQLEPSYVFGGTYEEAALRIVVQVAEALEHAHRRGVLHRDVKPSNVMVTPDGRAMLLDFGLAVGEESARLTRSGVRVGSLGYMPVEQAEGNLAAVNARSDVYSLGVTLYELLTLEMPFAAPSTQGLVKAIAEGRPRAIRALSPDVSWAAETVCLTAMAVDAKGRYASAADFARDVVNVLEGRPIEARRPGFARVVAQWAKRRPAEAAAVVLGLALLVGIPTTLYVKERDARERIGKEQENTKAEAVRAENNAQTAANNAARAERNFGLALEAVNAQLRELAVEELRFVPQMEPVRRKLVEKALALMQELGAETSSDPSLRKAMAETYSGVGLIQTELGDPVAADASYAKQRELLDGLALADPTNVEVARENAIAVRNRAMLPRTRGDVFSNTRILDDALAQFEALLALPGAGALERQEYGITLYSRGVAVLSQGPTACGPYVRRALEAFERAGLSAGDPRDETAIDARQHHARALNLLGAMCDDLGRGDESVAAHEAAAKLLEPIVDRYPSRADATSELAATLLNAGVAYGNLGNVAEGERVLVRAAALLAPLVRDYPRIPQYRMDLANAQTNLGSLLSRVNRDSESIAPYVGAMDNLRVLSDAEPGNQLVASALAAGWTNLSGARIASNDLVGAKAAGEEAVKASRALLAVDPNNAEAGTRLGAALHNLARVLTKLGDRVTAKAALLEAIELERAVLAREPTYSRAIMFLCNHYNSLADIVRQDGDYAASITTAETMIAIAPNDGVQWRRVAFLVCAAIPLAEADETLTLAARSALAQRYRKHALDLLGGAIDRGYSDKAILETNPGFDVLRDQPEFVALLARMK